VPGILHLRLVSAIHKPTTGRLTQFIQSVDVAERAAIFEGHAGVTDPSRRIGQPESRFALTSPFGKISDAPRV